MRGWPAAISIGLFAACACSVSPSRDYPDPYGDSFQLGDSVQSGDTAAGDARGDADGDGSFCPDPMCAGPACPGAMWDGLDGCLTCACAPPALAMETYAPHPQHVVFDASVARFIGGIDRWIFDFSWDYDDPGMADEEEVVTATVGVMHLPSDPISEDNLTLFISDGGLEPRGAQHILNGIVPTTTDLTFVDGYLSVRRNADRFEGGVYLELETVDAAQTVMTVAGSFDLPVP